MDKIGYDEAIKLVDPIIVQALNFGEGAQKALVMAAKRAAMMVEMDATIETQRRQIARLEAQVASLEEAATSDAAIMRVINRAIRHEVEAAIKRAGI